MNPANKERRLPGEAPADPNQSMPAAFAAGLQVAESGGRDEGRSHPTALQQRIDAAFLEGDMRAASELVESAPPGVGSLTTSDVALPGTVTVALPPTGIVTDDGVPAGSQSSSSVTGSFPV